MPQVVRVIELGNALSSAQGVAQAWTVFAKVTNQGCFFGQQSPYPAEITFHDGLYQAMQKCVLLRRRGSRARPVHAARRCQALLCTVHDLTRRRLALADRRCNVLIVDFKNLPEQERSACFWRQAIEQHQEGDGHIIVSFVDLLRCGWAVAEQWFGKPEAWIGFSAKFGRTQAINCHARGDRDKPGLWNQHGFTLILDFIMPT